MPRDSISDLVVRRQEEQDPRSSIRHLDLELAVYAEDQRGQRTDDVVLVVGGLWDRRRREYVGDARRARAVAAHPGQLEALRWFAAWLAAHLAGEVLAEPVYSILLAGGQRAGKTWIAVVIGAAYAVAVPGAIVWIVSPSDRRTEELEDLLAALLPDEWYRAVGAPSRVWRFANRSKIVLRSAHDPDGLKVGDADLVVLNEAQQLPERAFAIARGRTAAAAGLVVVAANPPTKPIGMWVGDFATEAQAGRREAKYFPLDPLDNPHVDRDTLLSLQQELDEHTFDIEVRGVFRGEKDAVLYNWSRAENEMPTPATGEITRDFLRWAERREFDRAVGVDMQRLPHMASVEMRFFANPLAPAEPSRFEWCYAWLTADVTLEAADEFDLAQAWLDLGWDPERTLIVADASGKWQFTQRKPEQVRALRDEVKGRGSWDVFKRMGFRHIVNPDRRLERNPDVIERCRATTARICTRAAGPFGQRFLFSDPANRELNKAIRLWPTKHGQPSRTSRYAHRGDCVTYLVQRFFARRTRRKGGIGYEGGRHEPSDRARELEGII